MEGKNNMIGELQHLRNPTRLRIIWAILYIIIFISIISAAYFAAEDIRTRSIPVGQVQLSVPYSKYLVGEKVSFTLTNNYNSPVYVLNKCPNEPLAVYKLKKDTWVRIHDRVSISECPSQQRRISVPANGVVHGTFAPWKKLFNKPGKYRVVAFVEYYNALPYQEFEVIKKPAIPKSSAPNSTPSSPSTQPSSPSTGNTGVQPTAPKKTKTVSIAQGSISVQYDSSTIYVTSIAPASGCSYEGGRSGREVEVTFKCGESETQIKLEIVNGSISTSIERGD